MVVCFSRRWWVENKGNNVLTLIGSILPRSIQAFSTTHIRVVIYDYSFSSIFITRQATQDNACMLLY